jgi:phosphonate transport system ATP-binding protein
MAAPILRVQNLTVIYPGVRPVKALDNVSLDIYPGEFVVVAGVSGSGKSALLRAINRLAENDHAQIQGNIYFDGSNILKASRRQIREIRSRIGFIFQEYNVVERSSVLTNALAGCLATMGLWSSLMGRFPKEQMGLAHQALVRVGIPEPRHTDRAARLSGGQKQRVGIARALLQKPKLILADEPVASLDPITANIVMNIFKKINEDEGITTIVNLHDPVLTFKYGQRIIGLKHGRIIYDKPITAINRETFEEDIYGTAEGG